MHNGEASVRQSDTPPQVRERQLALFRAMSAQRRLEMAFSLSQTTREMALEGLRRRRPSATERELTLELARLLYGPEVMARLSRRQG